MFKRIFGLIAALAGLTASKLEPSTAGSRYYATFPNGRYSFNGRTNGASRRRKSNRLHLSKATRRKHR